MIGIFTIAIKDLRILLRDRTGFFFTFLFPLLFAIFFGAILGKEDVGKIANVVLVDEDSSEHSIAFLADLTKTPELELSVSGRAEAADLVRKGQSTAFVIVRKGFGAARQRLFGGAAPMIELGYDPAHRAEAAMLHGILMKIASKNMSTLMSDSGAMNRQVQASLEAVQAAPLMQEKERGRLTGLLQALKHFLADSSGSSMNNLSLLPLHIDEVEVIPEQEGRPRSAFVISFPQGIIWGIIACAATFAISFVSERTNGTLLRLVGAPVRHIQIIAGKALACFLTIVAISALLMMVARLFFRVIPASPLFLTFSILLVAFAFVGIMIMLSLLGKTEQAANGIGWAIMLVLAMIGGGMIPLFLMPPWMQSISQISPVRWAILALEGPIWRNFTLQEIMLPWTVLLVTGMICLGIGVRLFRWYSRDS